MCKTIKKIRLQSTTSRGINGDSFSNTNLASKSQYFKFRLFPRCKSVDSACIYGPARPCDRNRAVFWHQNSRSSRFLCAAFTYGSSRTFPLIAFSICEFTQGIYEPYGSAVELRGENTASIFTPAFLVFRREGSGKSGFRHHHRDQRVKKVRVC